MDQYLYAILGFCIGFCLKRGTATTDIKTLIRIEDKLDLLMKNAHIEYNPYADTSPALLEAIRAQLRSKNKIAAIKLYKDAKGTGLKEAKDFVESMKSEF